MVVLKKETLEFRNELIAELESFGCSLLNRESVLSGYGSDILWASIFEDDFTIDLLHQNCYFIMNDLNRKLIIKNIDKFSDNEDEGFSIEYSDLRVILAGMKK